MLKLISFSFLALLVFTGCITKELPVQSTYSLSPKTVSIQQVFTPIDVSIYVKQPKTLAHLNSTKIFYTSDAYTQEAYALSKWSNTPSKMIQQRIASKLANEKRYNFVTTSRLDEKATVTISSELTQFEQTINNNQSHVTIGMRIFITYNNDVYSKTITLTKQAEPNAYGAVVAFNEATIELLDSISSYLLTTLKEK